MTAPTKQSDRPRKTTSVLLDADLILELVANRSGFIEAIETLIELIEDSGLAAHITDKCVKRVRIDFEDDESLDQPYSFFQQKFLGRIVPITPAIRERARYLSLVDLDSAEEHVCVEEYGFTAVVTPNPQNFNGATVPVWTPMGFSIRLQLEKLARSEDINTHKPASDKGTGQHQQGRGENNNDYLRFVSNSAQDPEDHIESASPSEAPNIVAFNIAIALLLNSKNPQAKSLLAFIRRTLRQYRLSGTETEIDIFIEAYLRGIEQMLNSPETKIRHPKAWIRATIHNIIREKARARGRMFQLTEDIPSEQEESVDSSRIEYCLNAVAQAYQNLEHDDRKLIELRFLRGFSWKGVHEKLGERDLDMSTLRKRGQRALNKLRKEYHKIISEDE